MNPFELSYDTLVNAFKRVPAFREMFREGNIITYSSKTPKVKTSVINSDVPEFAIFPNGVTGTLSQNADSSKITLKYMINISTGSADTSIINRCLWATMLGLMNWKSTVHTITFNDRRFIQDVRFSEFPIGISNPEANRGIMGWAAQIPIECDCYIDNKWIFAIEKVEAT